MVTLRTFTQLYPTAMKKLPLAIAVGLLSYNAASYAAEDSSYCLSAGSENNYACDKAIRIETSQADINAKLNELNRWLKDEELARISPQSQTSQPTSEDLRAKIESNAELLADELKQAKALQASGNHQGAFDQVNSYLGNNPKDPNAWLIYGVSLMNQNKLAEATDIFTKLIQLYPDAPEPYNNLAAVHARQGDNEKAVEVLLEAFETHPSYAQVQQNLKSVYAALATQAYNRALDLDDTQAPARAKLAVLDQVYAAQPIPQPAATITPSPAETKAMPVTETEPSAPPISQPAELVIEERDVSEGIVPVYDDESETVEQPVIAASTPVAEPAIAAPAETVVATAPAVAEPVNQAEPETPSVLDESTRADIEQLIIGWASAWSQQDVMSYLNFYTYGYSPSQDVTHRQWRQGRDKRLTKPAFIKVTVSDISLAQMDDGGVRTVFRQAYQSNTYEDVVYKTLIFRQQQDGWKIATETTL